MSEDDHVDALLAQARGAALLDAGRAREALAELHRAAAADVADTRTHSLIALAHLRLEDHRAALAAAERAAGLDPEAGWAHRLRAVALGELGDRRAARDAALQACRLEPEEALAHVVLSEALQAAGDEAGALEAARHAVTLAPEDATTHSQLGLVLLAHEREEEAATAFRTALSLDPEDEMALNTLSVARLRMGDRSGALTGLEAATRIDPTSRTVRENVLRVGGHARVYRRFAIAAAILGVLAAFASPVAGLVLLAVAGVLEVVRRASLRSLSEPTRALVVDDSRARRYAPARWDWSWPTRLRPWWWLLLQRIPAPLALALNAVLLPAAIVARLGLWIALLGIGLPFSIRRTWRWWRREHPGRDSWRPPAA